MEIYPYQGVCIMKKSLFLAISFILTVVFANVVKAENFSSKTLDSGPEISTEEKVEVEKQAKTEYIDLASNYAPKVVAKPTPANVDTTPVFRVTDYIASCNSVNCFTSKDAERGVVQYQNTFYYGHSSIAFNRLKTVYAGNVIRVIDANGITHNYEIAVRDVKSKAYLNGEGKTDGFTAGVYSANYYGTQYSAAFMTCGNGSNNDSNYRLILFAYEV